MKKSLLLFTILLSLSSVMTGSSLHCISYNGKALSDSIAKYTVDELREIQYEIHLYEINNDNAITNNMGARYFDRREERIIVTLRDIGEESIRAFKDEVCDSDALVFIQGETILVDD